MIKIAITEETRPNNRAAFFATLENHSMQRMRKHFATIVKEI
jgi:hypothetical protein